MRHFIISWSRVYGSLSSDNFKKSFKVTQLVVIIVVGIQGRLESQGREDLERRKETHPKDGYIYLTGSVSNRQEYYYGGKGLLLPLCSFYF